MPFESDLSVFYGAPFGIWCARRRDGEDDVPFQALRGAVDELALSGYAVAADYSLRYPTESVDLDEGDTVMVEIDTRAEKPLLIFGEVQGGTAYRVRAEPRRINDGAETQAELSSIAT